MKIEQLLLIILICVFIACKSSRKETGLANLKTWNLGKIQKENYISDFNLLTIQNDKYEGKDSLISISNSQTILNEKFAINNENVLTGLKYGLVEEFHLNGNLKSKGKYEIGKYTQCCAGGLCSQYYNYKYGEWNYFHENGNKEAVVYYQINGYNLKTSCEGGANIQFGKINSDTSKYWNRDGKEIKFSKAKLQELETVVFNQGELFSNSAKFQNEAISLIDGKVKLDLMYTKK